MSDKAMKIVLSVLTAVLLVLIVCLFAFKGNNAKVDLNKIALRSGDFRQYTSMSRSNVLSAMEKYKTELEKIALSVRFMNIYTSLNSENFEFLLDTGLSPHIKNSDTAKEEITIFLGD